jgi:hypothetical protein
MSRAGAGRRRSPVRLEVGRKGDEAAANRRELARGGGAVPVGHERRTIEGAKVTANRMAAVMAKLRVWRQSNFRSYPGAAAAKTGDHDAHSRQEATRPACPPFARSSSRWSGSGLRPKRSDRTPARTKKLGFSWLPIIDWTRKLFPCLSRVAGGYRQNDRARPRTYTPG